MFITLKRMVINKIIGNQLSVVSRGPKILILIDWVKYRQDSRGQNDHGRIRSHKQIWEVQNSNSREQKGKVQTKVEYKIKDKRGAYQKKIETSKQKWKGDGSKYIVNGIK